MPAICTGKRKGSSVSSATAPAAPEIPPSVKEVLEKNYSEKDRRILLELRGLIFETAQLDARIGTLTETLKWGEPAYLTQETKSGSTLRLGYSKLSQTPAMFVSCSTPLLQIFKEIDKERVLKYYGLRDIAVPQITEVNKKVLQTCMLKTLTYHLDKKKKNSTDGI